jgi:hypothetical protein
MRKKPPADFPDINAGDPWSETDLADLDELLSDGMPVAEIASYLCPIRRQMAQVPCWRVNMASSAPRRWVGTAESKPPPRRGERRTRSRSGCLWASRVRGTNTMDYRLPGGIIPTWRLRI